MSSYSFNVSHSYIYFLVTEAILQAAMYQTKEGLTFLPLFTVASKCVTIGPHIAGWDSVSMIEHGTLQPVGFFFIDQRNGPFLLTVILIYASKFLQVCNKGICRKFIIITWKVGELSLGFGNHSNIQNGTKINYDICNCQFWI